MARCDLTYVISRFRTKLGGGYKVRPSETHSTQLRDQHRCILSAHHSWHRTLLTQGMAEHAGKLGALQLVRAAPVGVVSQVALGDRPLGLRDSTYSGLDLGRNEMLSYGGDAKAGSACPVVERLMASVRRGGAIGSPGTLRGSPKSLEDLVESEAEKTWVRARAAEQTSSGIILVHKSSAWAHAACRRLKIAGGS